MIDEGMRALAEALRQQSAAYGFVARLLRTEVDDEALGRLRAMRFPAASGNDHLDAGYRGLCAYLNAGGERQHGDLAVGKVLLRQLGGGHVGGVRPGAEQSVGALLGLFGLLFPVDQLGQLVGQNLLGLVHLPAPGAD